MVLYPQCLSGCSEFACLAWFRRHARGSRMAFQSGRAVGPGGDLFLAHRARHSAQRLAGGRYGGRLARHGGASPLQFSLRPAPRHGLSSHPPLHPVPLLAFVPAPPSLLLFFPPAFAPPPPPF